MGKIKAPKHAPSLDMTPMVDLAFLLVTFFILTSQFRPDEAVVVDLPSSVSEEKPAESGMIAITMDAENKAYFSCDGQHVRREVLLEMGKIYGVSFNEEQIHKFSVISSFGVPIQMLPEWLSLDDYHRKKFNNPGIPIDSALSNTSANQLYQWILTTRTVGLKQNIRFRFSIKADQATNYTEVRKIMKVLENSKVFKFNFITNMKTSGMGKGESALVEE